MEETFSESVGKRCDEDAEGSHLGCEEHKSEGVAVGMLDGSQNS